MTGCHDGSVAMSAEEQQPFMLSGVYTGIIFCHPLTCVLTRLLLNFQITADSGFHSGERGDRHLGLYFYSGCRLQGVRFGQFGQFLCSTLGLALVLRSVVVCQFAV